MPRRIFIAVSLALFAGCTCPGAMEDHYAYAADQAFHAQIATCLGTANLRDREAACEPLCLAVMPLSADQDLDFCEVTFVDASGGVRLWERVTNYTACGDDSSDVGVAVGDSGGDGSTDDGSTDDGSGDGSDDGSSDDGSSDDGSSDDGSCRHVDPGSRPALASHVRT